MHTYLMRVYQTLFSTCATSQLTSTEFSQFPPKYGTTKIYNFTQIDAGTKWSVPKIIYLKIECGRYILDGDILSGALNWYYPGYLGSALCPLSSFVKLPNTHKNSNTIYQVNGSSKTPHQGKCTVICSPCPLPTYQLSVVPPNSTIISSSLVVTTSTLMIYL